MTRSTINCFVNRALPFWRRVVFISAWILIMVVAGLRQSDSTAGQGQFTIPPLPPELLNGSLECDNGHYPLVNLNGMSIFGPQHWNVAVPVGAPIIHSARIFFEQRSNPAADCASESVHVERIEGRDSWVVRAEDIETLPEPGKPFDVVLYQQVPATIGGAYSVSGWFLSLCGGSSTPSSCPENQYIVKAIGLGTQGGTDPDAPDVVWATSDANFVTRAGQRVGWTNLRTSAVANEHSLTVFARITSPFQWHGNHGFIDAIGLVRAPIARFLTAAGSYDVSQPFALSWQGIQSPDIAAIPGGTYELLYDVESRIQGSDEWQPLVSGTTATEVEFRAACSGVTYEFRLRARAEQPPAPPEGVSPNQRYPGVWSDPLLVVFEVPARRVISAQFENSLHLPFISDRTPC